MSHSAPNILFAFPDQHRPDWLGCNAALPLRTPNLDALMQRGVRFTNAFTPSPLCSPARACLATGRDYCRCDVRGNGQNTPVDAPNCYRSLRNAGYEVAGVGKFDLHKPDRDWGLDGSNMLADYGFTGGIDNEGKGDAIAAYRGNQMSPKGPYMQFLQERGLVEAHLAMYEPYMGKSDWLNFPAVTELPDDAYCDDWVAQNALDCLASFGTTKPWSLVVNFVGPHGPFDVTSGMRARWEHVELPGPVDNTETDRDQIAARRQNYAAMIENIDRHVGRMLEAVRERGELDNTIVVYSSDHGEMLGDHNRWAKSVWHTPSSGVPMIVAGPGIAAGVTSTALVSLHDLAATFLDVAGAPALPENDAVSMWPVLAGRCMEHREFVVSALGDWALVFDGRFKLVRRLGAPTLLYDLEDDPDEVRNVAERHPDVVADLNSKLAAHEAGDE